MSKHHRTAGVDYRPMTINGKTYTMRPFTLGCYAAMEAYIVSQRPDPLAIAAEAVDKLPAKHHRAIWDAATSQAIKARIVTAEEISAFENSVEGLSWKVWQCLHEDHPEIDSVAAAQALLMEAGQEHFEELARATEIATGEADLKKSSGPAEEATAVDPAGPSYTGD